MLLVFLVASVSPINVEAIPTSYNNPGNIKKTEIQWNGEIPCSSVKFECFESLYHGVRALVLNLKAYKEKHKLTTIEQVIHRWAPPFENNTEAYINIVANKLGIKRDEYVDFLEPTILIPLVKAIIAHETPSANVSTDLIKEVIHDTLGTTYAAGERPVGGHSETVGDETGRGTSEKLGDDTSNIQAEEGLGRSSGSEEHTPAVDPKSAGSNNNTSSSSLASCGPGVLARSSSNTWLDRIQSWLSFHGWERSDGVERSTWISSNPPPHTSYEFYCWTVLRRFVGRA
jgi:hypothetical protein